MQNTPQHHTDQFLQLSPMSKSCTTSAQHYNRWGQPTHMVVNKQTSTTQSPSVNRLGS